MVQNRPSPHIHISSKPTGAICNLACSYLFLNKEFLYPGNSFHMSYEVLENYIQQLVKDHSSLQVTVAWQGVNPSLWKLVFIDVPSNCRNGIERRV